MKVATVKMLKEFFKRATDDNEDIEEWLCWQVMARLAQLRGEIAAARRFRGALRNGSRRLPKGSRAQFAALLKEGARLVDDVLVYMVTRWKDRGEARWAAEVLERLARLDEILYHEIPADEGGKSKILFSSLLYLIASNHDRNIIYIDAVL